MRLYKRDDNWGIDYLYQDRRIRVLIGPNKKQAEAALAKVRSQIVEGKYFEMKKNEKIRFDEMAKRYMDNHSSVNNSPETFKYNPYLISFLSKHFGKKYLYEIRELDIDRYKKSRLESGVKQSTINRELNLLRGILNKAKAWGMIKTEVPKIKIFKLDNTRVRYLEEAEAQTLLQACQEPLKSIVLVALNTGLRRGEILNLKWQDINFPERFITVRETKSKRNRYVQMNAKICELLQTNFSRRTEDYVFPGNTPGSHLSKAYVTHWFGRIVRQAGIKDLRFHDLRHTFASWLVMDGIDLKTVQELLGHQNYQMTLKYSHLSPEHRQYAVDVLAGKMDKLSIRETEHGTNLAQTEIPVVVETPHLAVNQ